MSLSVFLVGSGAIAGHAAWNAQTSKSATAAAGTVGLTVSGIEALSGKFKAASMSITAPITITNTGSTPLGYSLATTNASSALANNIELRVWKQVANCNSVPSGAAVGTLAAPPALPAGANSAASLATLTLCAKATLTGAHNAFVGQSASPTLTVTGQVGTNWTTAASGTFTQLVDFTWYQIVHNRSSKCLDGFGAQTGNGTDLIIWPCKALATNNNQAWRLDPTSGSWVRVIASYGGNLAWRASGNGNGSDVELWAADSSDRQEWRFIQHGSAGHYLIENRYSDRCLDLNDTADETVAEVRNCTSSTNPQNESYERQHFRLVEIP